MRKRYIIVVQAPKAANMPWHLYMSSCFSSYSLRVPVNIGLYADYTRATVHVQPQKDMRPEHGLTGLTARSVTQCDSLPINTLKEGHWKVIHWRVMHWRVMNNICDPPRQK